MTQDTSPEWSENLVAHTFREELYARFRAHNEAYRLREEAELAEVLAKHPEKRGQPGYDVRDSFAWEFLNCCQIRIEGNVATIVTPIGYALRTDLLPLFDHLTMAWSRPIIGATIVDGEPRPTIEITLVATWTDEMHDKWRAEGNDRRQVSVELYEEDIHALRTLVDAHGAGPNSRALRDRLLSALEPIP